MTEEDLMIRELERYLGVDRPVVGREPPELEIQVNGWGKRDVNGSRSEVTFAAQREAELRWFNAQVQRMWLDVAEPFVPRNESYEAWRKRTATLLEECERRKK